MTEDAHRHTFYDTVVRDGHGTPVAGRRCDCGVETIGLLNAQVIRASQHLHDAMVAGLRDLARRMR